MAKHAEADSLLTPPKDNAALKWKKLSDAQQENILSMPAHTPDAVQKLLKPGEGMEAVASEVFDLLEGAPEIAKALKLDVKEMRKRSNQRQELLQYEGTTYKLYRRAAENRMAADSDLYAALLKVNRFVQGASDAELSHDFSDLTDWVANSHAHGARDAKKEGTATDDNAPAAPKTPASAPTSAPADVKA